MTILDTNVVSEMMKPDPLPAVADWMSSQDTEHIFTTAITVSETMYGIELLPRGRRRDGLLRAAESIFAAGFSGRILSFDESAARSFAMISAVRPSGGRPIGIHDAQIAAIARANGALLATRDTRDFEGCGVRLVNPWMG